MKIKVKRGNEKKIIRVCKVKKIIISPAIESRERAVNMAISRFLAWLNVTMIKRTTKNKIYNSSVFNRNKIFMRGECNFVNRHKGDFEDKSGQDFMVLKEMEE